MQYKDLGDLERLTTRALSSLPRNIDLVITLPNFPSISATLISRYLDVPLAQLDALVPSTASDLKQLFRQTLPAQFGSLESRLTVLVIVDSLEENHTLQALIDAQERLQSINALKPCYFAAALGTTRSKKYVDFCFGEIADDDIFSWSWMHHPIISESCVDMDGVLCENPDYAIQEQTPEYNRFLESASPLFLPSQQIGSIVTGRLDMYREQTVAWLKRHGVRYQNLSMLPVGDARKKKSLGGGAGFKADAMRDYGAKLFVESSYFEAAYIARESGKEVLCIDDNLMIHPTAASRILGELKQLRSDSGVALSRARLRSALRR